MCARLLIGKETKGRLKETLERATQLPKTKRYVARVKSDSITEAYGTLEPHFSAWIVKIAGKAGF